MSVIERIDSLALSSLILQMMTAMFLRMMMLKMKMTMTAVMIRTMTIKMKNHDDSNDDEVEGDD